jgi:hypothetical protein
MAPVELSDNQAATAPRNLDSPGAAERTAEPLTDEVAAFLARREELARRLEAEITATERRLIELRRQLVLLYPERATAGTKERKPRKAKLSRSKSEDQGLSTSG